MLTLTTALDRTGRLYGANRAIVDYERTFTWDEHLGRVAKAAGVLQGLGPQRGDRFAVLSRNTFRHCELLHAGYWAASYPCL